MSLFEGVTEEPQTDGLYDTDDKETPPQSTLFEGHPEESAPREKGKRASGADFFEWAYRGIGMALQRSSPQNIPVGRVVSFQAPVAGNRIDHLIAGTWIDGLLQPLFKKTGDIEGLGSLVALPVIVGIMTRNPAMSPVLVEVLRPAVMSTFNEMAPLLRAERNKERKNYRTVAELNDLLGLERGADPFDAFMATIFAPPESEQQTQESETE